MVRPTHTAAQTMCENLPGPRLRSIRAGESHLYGKLIHNFFFGRFRFSVLGSFSFNSYLAFVGCHTCLVEFGRQNTGEKGS